MKRVMLLIVGVGAGFAAGHWLNRTAKGRAIADDLDARVRGFTTAVVDGYRTREAELRSATDARGHSQSAE